MMINQGSKKPKVYLKELIIKTEKEAKMKKKILLSEGNYSLSYTQGVQ